MWERGEKLSTDIVRISMSAYSYGEIKSVSRMRHHQHQSKSLKKYFFFVESLDVKSFNMNGGATDVVPWWTFKCQTAAVMRVIEMNVSDRKRDGMRGIISQSVSQSFSQLLPNTQKNIYTDRCDYWWWWVSLPFHFFLILSLPEILLPSSLP